MPAEVTTVVVRTGDITQLTIGGGDVTPLSVQAGDTTVITSASATINAAALSLSDSQPSAIARTASAGVSTLVSRSDHTHSAANLLLDGGNY